MDEIFIVYMGRYPPIWVARSTLLRFSQRRNSVSRFLTNNVDFVGIAVQHVSLYYN